MTAANWNQEMIPLKRLARINDSTLGEDTPADRFIRYVDISNVNENGRILEPQELTFEKAPSRARRLVTSGDTIISTVRTYLKAIAYLPDPDPETVVSTGFAVLTPKPGVDSRYLAWAVRSDSFVGDVVSRSVGVSYPAIAPTELGDIPLPIHPPVVQRKIADFLDRETAKIDALIAEKERLLKLLDERRQALITEAVTRGLDPTVPMKPSGLPWLGSIPAHWNLVQSKRCILRIEQGWSPDADARPADPDEWGVMRAGCVNGGTFDPTDNKAMQVGMQPDETLEVIEGDVLMSRANTRTLLGSCALVQAVRRKLMLCDKLFRITVDETSISRRFYVLAVMSRYVRHQFEGDATGASSSMQNIGQDTVRNAVLALPPIGEQRDILQTLEIRSAEIAEVTQALQKTADLMAARRASLIHEAVTGKIQKGASI